MFYTLSFLFGPTVFSILAVIFSKILKPSKKSYCLINDEISSIYHINSRILNKIHSNEKNTLTSEDLVLIIIISILPLANLFSVYIVIEEFYQAVIKPHYQLYIKRKDVTKAYNEMISCTKCNVMVRYWSFLYHNNKKNICEFECPVCKEKDILNNCKLKSVNNEYKGIIPEQEKIKSMKVFLKKLKNKELNDIENQQKESYLKFKEKQLRNGGSE